MIFRLFKKKRMKIEIKEGILYLNNNPYGNGETIIGTIKGTEIRGVLRICESAIGHNTCYFCHTDPNYKGSKPEDKNTFGFPYSWIFNKLTDESFTENVILFDYKGKKMDIEKFKINKHFCIEKGNEVILAVYENNKITEGSTLFKFRQIENCCGAILLHNFQNNSPYENYDLLKKEELDAISTYLTNTKTNKIAYLLKIKESNAINLLEKLNFKIVNEFTNSNTANKIAILLRNN